MRINRVRNFKSTFEATITFTGAEAERLSHVISVLKDSRFHGLYRDRLFPDYKAAGVELLEQLNRALFWDHWESDLKKSRQKKPSLQQSEEAR